MYRVVLLALWDRNRKRERWVIFYVLLDLLKKIVAIISPPAASESTPPSSLMSDASAQGLAKAASAVPSW
jgi:hypothetical protein